MSVCLSKGSLMCLRFLGVLILENRFIVEVEVIGDGIIMWLLSQGSKVKILQPQFIKKLYLEEIKKMHQNNI
ncbi:hypothetical protein [Mammaliicoccus sciuri]|uniref:hypothetical protein n=2 Tax=Mammaliicoccus sciuri TaxID=1296 RepID=UPI003F558436